MKKDVEVIIVQTKVLKGKLNKENGEIEVYEEYIEGNDYNLYGIKCNEYGVIVDKNECDGDIIEVKSKRNGIYFESNYRELFKVD